MLESVDCTVCGANYHPSCATPLEFVRNGKCEKVRLVYIKIENSQNYVDIKMKNKSHHKGIIPTVSHIGGRK